MLIQPFQNLSKNDTEIAGGKGASLGEMTKAGIPVPPGFVLLSDAFERFLEETDLNIEIDAQLSKVNHDAMHTVEYVSAKIQALILQAAMPKDIKAQIQKEFKKLNAQYVAVRSSATAEDSSEAAWAGQLDSFLNTTEKSLLENVKKCWASLFTPRAIFYRFEQNLHKQKISVAVVIQKMIDSEKSGIAFSVHPVTEDHNQLIIEAGFGLGEAIVSGQITPDGYVVEKEPRRIIDININDQTKALYRKDGGDNQWHNLEDKGKQQVLTEKQILELTKLILNIEKHYGFPVDIEWAFEGGEFYIVQSRPITTLQSVEDGQGSCSIKILKNTFSREKKLYYFDLWDYCDKRGIKKYFDMELEDNLFIIPSKGESGSVWHVEKEMSQLVEKAVKILQDASENSIWKKIKNDAWTAWNYLKPYALGKDIEDIEAWKCYQKHLLLFWTAMNSVIWEAIDNPEINITIRKEFISIREESEKFVNRTSALVTEYFEKNFSKYKAISHVLTFEEMVEITKGDLLASRLIEIQKRKNGCFLLGGKVYSNIEALDKILKNNNLKLEKESAEGVSELQGSVAKTGNVKGIVKNIKTESEISKIKKGDILVATMTSPNFVPAIKIASAIITDEGGSLCHAAIISRELGKPCIIGTKIATQVLKDGDLVEVDADNGVVRILERGGEK